MKKRLVSLLCAVVVLMMVLPTMAASAGTTQDPGLDVVIIIDRSGTMQGTDPNNIALEAAKMFVDRCNLQDNSVAVIAYGYEILFQTDFVNLSFNTLSDRQQLQADIENEIPHCGRGYDSSQDTNTGLALNTAYALIQERRAEYPNHQFAVLLISDGKIDIGDSKGYKDDARNGLVGTPEEETQKSTNLAYQVTQMCVNDGIPICCLGLYNGDANILGEDMSKWVSQTGGVYRTTEDINEVASIVRDLYLGITGNPNPVPLKDGSFDIGDNVLEANIEILSLDDIADITLKDPDNNVVDLVHPDGISVIISDSSTYYKSIKLVKPKPGTWTLSFQEGYDDLQVTITYNMDLSMNLEMSQLSIANQGTVTAKLDVTRQNQPYYDPTQTAHLTITAPDGSVETVPMTYDQANQMYTADKQVDQTGDYIFQASITTQNMDNVSNKATVTVLPRGLSANPAVDLPDYTFAGRLLGHYDPYVYVDDLATLFDDPDRIGIDSFQVAVYPEGYVEYDLDEATRTLTLTAVDDRADIEITITAIDGNGAVSEARTAKITVVNDQKPLEQNAAEVAKLIPYEIQEFLPQKEGDIALTGLAGFFVEPNANDGEGVADFTAVSDDSGIAECAIDGDTLVVRGIAEGETDVTVMGISSDGSTQQFRMHIVVKSLLKTILIYAGIGLAALLVILLIIKIIANAAKPMFKSSTLTITIPQEGYGEEERSVPLQKHGKRKVKLTALIRESGMHASGIVKYTDKIYVMPRKKGIIVRCDLKNVRNKEIILKPFDTKQIELSARENLSITLEYTE